MEKHPIIFFDGYCGLCNGFVDFVLPRDKNKHFRFATLQGTTAARLLSKEDVESLDSVVVYMDRQKFRKSRAVLRVFSQMGGAWSLLSFFGILPTFFLDFFYDIVANNRYAWFGKRDVCRLPTPEERALFLD
jgi:predicted DCC family thiol-disulfide oxidoreductase YuxK